MAVIENLTISSFRGIRNLTVEKLGPINLIVGDNNSGKTSVLEALELLAGGGIANIYRTARQRESLYGPNTSSIYEAFISMFPKTEDVLEIGISADIDSVPVSYSVRGRESKILLDSADFRRSTARAFSQTETDAFDGGIEYGKGGTRKREDIHLTRYSSASGTAVSSENGLKIAYVSPFEHLMGNTISTIVKNEGYKEICLRALQLFDPDIMDMMIFRSDAGDRPVEYLRHRKLGAMPLSTYGDGIKKVLVLANAVACAEGGILLIDEIGTDIHKKYYDDIFRFIVKACRAFSVQAFFTTHSIEAIDALLQTQDYPNQTDTDDIMVVTLKRADNRTYSRVMTGRTVLQNREAFNFEVRL